MKLSIAPLALCLALPVMAQTTATGSGQAYPVRPLRMMVPAAAAGVTDIAARVLAPQLSEALGQSVVVDNRAGAGGIIGTDTVAKATPDGYSLITVFDSFVSNPYVFTKIPYDTLQDFAPICLLIRGPQFYPQFEAQSWVRMLAPAATPHPIVQRLNTEVNKILANGEVKERFNTLGYEIAGGSPQQFGVWLRSESVKWGKVIRDNNITAE